MKKLLYTLFGVLFVILVVACDRNSARHTESDPPSDSTIVDPITGSVDVQRLKAAIRSSQTYNDYQYSTRELMKAAVDGSISFTEADQEVYREVGQQVTSPEEFKHDLKALGVKGGDKYAGLLYMQARAMRELAREHPELRQLNKQELRNLLTSVIEFDSVPALLPQRD